MSRRPPRFYPAWTSGGGINPSAPDFQANFADLGAGEVDLTLTRGSGVATFSRATGATTFLSTRVPANVASGVPRSWYTPDGTYAGYIGDPAATNICLWSEDLSNAAWSNIGTPTLGTPLAWGSVSLDLLGDDSAAAVEGKSQVIAFTGSVAKTVSLFVAEGSSTSGEIRLRDTTAGADRLLVTIAWSGGVPTPTVTTGTLLGMVGPFANGVYRLEVLTGSVTATNTNQLELYPASDAALSVLATGTMYMGGVMVQNATTVCLTYVPTTDASVTKNTDALSYDSANMLEATGTWFAECSEITTSISATVRSFVDGGNASTGLLLGRQGTSAVTTISMDDGPTVLEKTGLTSLLTAPRKRASSYGGVTMSVTGDGAAPATGTFDGAMTATFVTFRTNVQGITVKNVKGWLTQATDQQLQDLTA